MLYVNFPLYEDLRNSLFANAKNIVHNFDALSMFNKMCVALKL